MNEDQARASDPASELMTPRDVSRKDGGSPGWATPGMARMPEAADLPRLPRVAAIHVLCPRWGEQNAHMLPSVTSEHQEERALSLTLCVWTMVKNHP